MADGQLTAPLVSINIPGYHQLDHVRRCIGCLRAQTLDNLEITLLDDGASDAYRDYVASLGDARVRYHRNPERLGAMRNMFQAILTGRGKYSMAFHEDDLVGSHYVATAVSILERDPACGLVAGELREFVTEPSPAALAAAADRPAVVTFASPADFLRALFRGVRIDRLPAIGARRRDAAPRRVCDAGRPPVPAADPRAMVRRHHPRSARVVPQAR
jgi:glycosyl transferase family 2